MTLSFATELKLAIAGIALVVGVGVWGKIHHTPAPIISIPVPGVTSISIPGPITPDVVKEYVTDPAQAKLISDLLAENKKYKLQVISLTSSVGELTQRGGVGVNEGVITRVDAPESSPSVSGSTHGPSAAQPAEVVQSFGFKDFQLDAGYNSNGSSFTYNLDQKFSVVTTTGKNNAGVGVSIVKLFQTNGPNGPLPIPVVTTEIASDPNPAQWFFAPRIQGGFSLGAGGEKGGVVSLQWLRRGRSLAAEDSSFGLLEPALTIGGAGAKLALIPINVNLGSRGKFNPFHNIWVGPTINLNKQVGLVITATF